MYPWSAQCVLCLSAMYAYAIAVHIISIHCIIVLLYYVVHESNNIRFQASDAAARAKNKRSTPIEFFLTIVPRKLRVKMHRQREMVCERNVHL